MRVTNEMVERMCKILAESDWLPIGWDDGKHDACPNCGARGSYGEGDGGASIRDEVRNFLEATLNP